jgi:integral membrane sensor domain MASE1
MLQQQLESVYVPPAICSLALARQRPRLAPLLLHFSSLALVSTLMLSFATNVLLSLFCVVPMCHMLAEQLSARETRVLREAVCSSVYIQ